MEKVVHETQVDEDVQDDEEYASNHAHKVESMIEEGWIFESPQSSSLSVNPSFNNLPAIENTSNTSNTTTTSTTSDR